MNARRGPKTSHQWVDRYDVNILRHTNGDGGFELRFTTGGDDRKSDLAVEIEPDDFEALASAMLSASRSRAILAFAKATVDELEVVP